MRPESREITSCLDLASKTRQEEEKKTQKKVTEIAAIFLYFHFMLRN